MYEGHKRTQLQMSALLLSSPSTAFIGQAGTELVSDDDDDNDDDDDLFSAWIYNTVSCHVFHL